MKDFEHMPQTLLPPFLIYSSTVFTEYFALSVLAVFHPGKVIFAKTIFKDIAPSVSLPYTAWLYFFQESFFLIKLNAHLQK